jgi:molybdate transport system substrate-binding protein
VRRLLLLAAGALALAGCGDDATVSGGGGDTPRLVVSAATSLKGPLEKCAGEFEEADVRVQFAGSDVLAGQIRQGAGADVFAAANTKLPEQLAAEGELEAPVVFTSNKLVLARPANDTTVSSVSELGANGVKLVIGAEGVPVGDYAREVIDGIAGAEANIRSTEPDVAGVVGKLVQGTANAGFIYASDLEAAGDRLREIALPAYLQQPLEYGAGVVAATQEPEAAEAFVDDLLAGGCHDALIAAGFGEP